MSYCEFIYVCGECFDCAVVKENEGRFDRGVPCPNCENTIWFDVNKPDIRVDDPDIKIEYDVSDVWEMMV